MSSNNTLANSTIHCYIKNMQEDQNQALVIFLLNIFF